MSESKTHWKKFFNYDYLGSYSIEPGSDLVLTIKTVGKEMVTGQNGKKEECFVAYFTDSDKPMILNRTNCKIIEKVYRSPHVEDWTGKQIQLYVAAVSAFGTTTDALRIREFKPDAKAERATAALEKLKAEIRDMLANYKGNNLDDIKTRLNAARTDGKLNIQFAKKMIAELKS